MCINNVISILIFKWMGVMIRGWSSEVVKYFLIYQPVQRKERKKVSRLVWLTMDRCIWFEQNDVLFNRKVANSGGG